MDRQGSSNFYAIPAATISLGKIPNIKYYWQGYCDVPPEREVSNSFTNVFANHLLLDNLLTFMDVHSMKMFGSTCHWLYVSVRKNRSFQMRTKLTLSDDIFEYVTKAFKNEHPQISKQSVLPFRSYVIGPCGEWDFGNNSMSTSTLNFDNLPCQAKKLFFLARNGFPLKDIVLIGDSRIPDSRNEIVHLLQNLKCLESVTLKEVGLNYPDTSISRILLDSQKSLKSLSIDQLQCDPENFIGGLLLPTLRTLEFSTKMVLPNFSKLFDSVPALEHLTIRTIGSNVHYVTRLIKSLPSLQSLSLVLEDDTSDDNVLRQALRMRIHSRLTKFHVAWKVPIYNPTSIGWSFLRNWKQLQDIELYEVTFDDGEDVLDADAQDGVPSEKNSFLSTLSSIPDTVKHLAISGVSLQCIGANIPMDVKVELSRFTNALSVLDIFRCRNAVTDEILGFICTHFVQLQEFGFSHCDGVTDLGLIGCEDVDGNIIPGLSALKHLRKLRIAACNYVSLNGYKESISFPHLNHLTLIVDDYVRETSKIERIPCEFYLQLIAQNKWLQTFDAMDDLFNTQRKKEYISFGWKMSNAEYFQCRCVWKSVNWSGSLKEKLPITFTKLRVHLDLPSVEDAYVYEQEYGGDSFELDECDTNSYDLDDF